MSAYRLAQIVKKPFRKACLWGDRKFFDPSSTPLSSELEENYFLILDETKKLWSGTMTSRHSKIYPRTRLT